MSDIDNRLDELGWRALKLAQETLDVVVAERDRLRDELAEARADREHMVALRRRDVEKLGRYEPVYEAAKAWRACFDDEGEICNRIALGDIEVKLADAIDAAGLGEGEK